MNRHHKIAALALVGIAYFIVAILVLREQSTASNFTLCPLCGK